MPALDAQMIDLTPGQLFKVDHLVKSERFQTEINKPQSPFELVYLNGSPYVIAASNVLVNDQADHLVQFDMGGQPTHIRIQVDSQTHPLNVAQSKNTQDQIDEHELSVLRGYLTQATQKQESLTTTTPNSFCVRKPLAKMVKTSPFGRSRLLPSGHRYIHWGTDYSATVGTEVFPLADGKVIWKGTSPIVGQAIFIEHPKLGLASSYFHLNETQVEIGDSVSIKKPIAKTGSTGRSSGPHLHLEVAFKGRLIDPESLFSAKELNCF